MKFEIKKFNKLTLIDYLNSDKYRNSDIWPISFHRARSHCNNPRIDNSDILLIIAEAEGKILGYRTVMADIAFNGSERLKVGWISGTWVDPEFRRKGLATDLFEEINSDWNSQLMYTNYAPISKKVYDKTGVFENYFSTIGCRFHMKSDLAEILPARFPLAKSLGKILPTADNFFNHYILPFITEPGMKSRLSYNMVLKTRLNDDEVDLLFKNTLTVRGAKELNWILDYPWVKQVGEIDEAVLDKYFFSAAADLFRQYFCLIFKNEKLVAIVMITLRNKQMKVPYFYSYDADLALIADLIFTEAWKNSISYIDIYDETLVKEMKLKTAYYAFSKSRDRSYMVSKSLIDKFPNPSTITIPDGEGDVVFV